MLYSQQPAHHAGLTILSEALAQAREAGVCSGDGRVSALGYECTPDVEALDAGRGWRPVMTVRGRGEQFTVVGRAFGSRDEAWAHARRASLVELYDGKD